MIAFIFVLLVEFSLPWTGMLFVECSSMMMMFFWFFVGTPSKGVIWIFHELVQLVLVLQVRRLVVHGPLELGLTFLVSRGAGASFLGLPKIEVA